MVVVRKHEVKKEATDKQVRRASRRQQPCPLSIPAARTELENIGSLVGWQQEIGYQWQRIASVVHLLLVLPVDLTSPKAARAPKSTSGSSRNSIRDPTTPNPSAGAREQAQACPAPLSLRREDPGLWAPATLKLILPPPKHRRRRYMQCASVPRRLRPVPHALALACAVRHALLFILVVVIL